MCIKRFLKLTLLFLSLTTSTFKALASDFPEKTLADRILESIERKFNEILVETLVGPQCNANRPRPRKGIAVPVTTLCESSNASTYYLKALAEGNQFQIDKVKGKACIDTNQYGRVDQVLETVEFPRPDDKATLYFSSVVFTDDLYGKKMYGLAFGCGEELPEHRNARLRAEAERLRAEAERKRAEEERLRAEAVAIEKLTPKELAELAAEKEKEQLALLDAMASEKAADNLVDAMTVRITRAWRQPVAFKGGLETHVQIALASNGKLADVRVVKSSGDILFDNSVLKAVQRAAPFDEIKRFNAATFEKKFRSITVKFRPY